MGLNLDAIPPVSHQMVSLSHWEFVKPLRFMTHVSEESGSDSDCRALPERFYTLWKTFRAFFAITKWQRLASDVDISHVTCSCSGLHLEYSKHGERRPHCSNKSVDQESGSMLCFVGRRLMSPVQEIYKVDELV